MTDLKVTNAAPDIEARTEAVLALMIEEFKRLGHVQRDEDGRVPLEHPPQPQVNTSIQE